MCAVFSCGGLIYLSSYLEVPFPSIFLSLSRCVSIYRLLYVRRCHTHLDGRLKTRETHKYIYIYSRSNGLLIAVVLLSVCFFFFFAVSLSLYSDPRYPDYVYHSTQRVPCFFILFVFVCHSYVLGVSQSVYVCFSRIICLTFSLPRSLMGRRQSISHFFHRLLESV